MWWQLLIGAGLGLAVTWLALIVVLVRVRPRAGLLSEALRILPDVLRLIRRLAADRSLPRGIRLRMWCLLLYLGMPFDLIPDFIPVLGYADDAIIVTFVLRAVVRRAGLPAIRAHWPGTDDGFTTLARITNLAPSEPPTVADRSEEPRPSA
jgi:uncharacterized membrane protein YkvA (DUF1232 family)